jgi:hypothetical protein
MKKTTLYILLILTALLMIGCRKKAVDNGGTNPDDSGNSSIVTLTMPPSDNQVDQAGLTVTPVPTQTAENHEGEMRSYLSGLWVPVEVGTKRPLAIQFNNFVTVKNQWGIGQADIVYECLVEGGITRLLGIGENFSGDKLGSVRSSRHYFVSIADEYDAIYIHFGKTKYATSKMKKLGIDHLDGTTGIGANIYYRDKSIKAPHNAFTSLEKINAGIDKAGFRTQYEAGYQPHFLFNETDTDLTSANTVSKVTVHFSASHESYFEYNSTDKLYYAFQYKDIHKDSLTGEQLAFKNIIVQFVKEWNIDKNGYQTMDIENASGSGYYITNGKMIPITWKKNEAESFMRYYNEAGEELTINPGKTYITLFPRDQEKNVKIVE